MIPTWGLVGCMHRPLIWVQWYLYLGVFNPLSLQGVQIGIQSSSSVILYWFCPLPGHLSWDAAHGFVEVIYTSAVKKT